MAAVGTSVEIADEALMDVVTAVSGSGPAYVVLLAEAWQTAAQAQGLSADAARALVNQTLLGAARMLLETNETATTLRQRVTSPGGTTHAAISQLQAHGFATLIDRAIVAATRARTHDGEGKDGPVLVDLGGGRLLHNKNTD